MNSQPTQSPSHGSQARRSRRAVVWAALLALLFVAGTVIAPTLENVGIRWGGLLRIAYAPLCHQNPARSLAIGDGTQAVCARCAGLYLGGVLGLLAGAWAVGRGRLRPRASWLAWVAAPTLIDVLLGAVGAPSLSNVPRLLLALPLGVLGAAFLADGIADLSGKTTPHRAPPRALEETDG